MGLWFHFDILQNMQMIELLACSIDTDFNYVITQSVLGRNECVCSSSHALCNGPVQSCAIHNSFALYDGNVIHPCHANKF